jgi:hypothetical protein
MPDIPAPKKRGSV